MRGLFILIIIAVVSLNFSEAFAKKQKCKKPGVASNIYISKKYKGHSCPKPRQIINAKYY